METAARLIIDILLSVLNGADLKAAILERIEAQDHPLLGYPFLKWLKAPDEHVIGARLSPACYVEDAVPAVIYLALKYHDDPQKALIANTNLGGDNAGRGSVLGALLGAYHGKEGFPAHWREALLEPLPELISIPGSDVRP